MFHAQLQVPVMIDGISTDDEGPRHRSMGLKTDLRTSSPIKSASVYKWRMSSTWRDLWIVLSHLSSIRHFERFDAIDGYRKSTFWPSSTDSSNCSSSWNLLRIFQWNIYVFYSIVIFLNKSLFSNHHFIRDNIKKSPSSEYDSRENRKWLCFL